MPLSGSFGGAPSVPLFVHEIERYDVMISASKVEEASASSHWNDGSARCMATCEERVHVVIFARLLKWDAGNHRESCDFPVESFCHVCRPNTEAARQDLERPRKEFWLFEIGLCVCWLSFEPGLVRHVFIGPLVLQSIDQAKVEGATHYGRHTGTPPALHVEKNRPIGGGPSIAVWPRKLLHEARAG